MKDLITRALEDVADEGLLFWFDDEAEMNQFFTWAVNFIDRNTVINPPHSKSIGMPI